MAKYAKLKSFYASEKWINFRQLIIDSRAVNGEVICEHCHKVIKTSKDIIAHHTTELTPENVDNVDISLNPEKIMLVHHDCHNEIHHRFGYNNFEHGVFIVFGAPLSGKHTYVKQNIRRGDLVVDMDKLYEAISFMPTFDKPGNLLMNVRIVYNTLIDNIKTRCGKWNSAWVIGGYADKYQRERTANNLGAELIFCDVSKEECLRRLEYDDERQSRKDEWKKFIGKWFEQYSE